MALIVFIILLALNPFSAGVTAIKSKPRKSKPSNTQAIEVIPADITPSDLPYDPELWNDHYEEILSIVGKPVKVRRNSPEAAYVTLDIHKGKYKDVVNSLREEGYNVRNVTMGKIHLDESKSAIEWPYAWYTESGYRELTGAGTKIAIIDTGLDAEHADFAGKDITWYDMFEYCDDPCDLSYVGHGTHVASIAAGTGAALTDGKYKGVAPDADLVAIRACNTVGGCPEDYVATALDNAINELPDVISLSLGYPQYSNVDDCNGDSIGAQRDIYEQIQRAKDYGIPVVASVGNDGIRTGSVEFPACIDEVIGVGATFKQDYRNYVDIDYDGWDGAALVHVIVDVSGGFNTHYEYEWQAQSNTGSGFDHTFYVTAPTTVKVRIEGLWKFRCPFYNEGWNPGGSEKGDSYWIWIEDFPANTDITLQIGVRPIYDTWNAGVCFQTYWNDAEDTIRVRIDETETGLKDRVLLWSGRGPAPQGTTKPDVVAPGVKVCAARSHLSLGGSTCDDDRYIAHEGTSMAAPHVAGLVALLKEGNPELTTVDKITTALKKADKHVFDPYLEGEGRINVRKAVRNFVEGKSCESSSDCCCNYVCDNNACVTCASYWHIQLTNAGSGYQKCEAADLGTPSSYGVRGSYCTASLGCDEQDRLSETSTCSYRNKNRIDFCSNTCIISDKTCESSCPGYTGSWECDEKNPGASCGAGLECDSNCKCVYVGNEWGGGGGCIPGQCGVMVK